MGFPVADLAEKALAGPEHDRVDHQPHLVDEVMLRQRGDEPRSLPAFPVPR
jgi:hypothetical protein